MNQRQINLLYQIYQRVNDVLGKLQRLQESAGDSDGIFANAIESMNKVARDVGLVLEKENNKVNER